MNIRTVLSARLAARNIDQLDAVGMEVPHVVAVIAPIAIGPLHHDAPLLEQALQDQVDFEPTALHIAHTQGEVFEIDKYGNQGFIGHGDLELGWRFLPPPGSRGLS